MAPMISASDGTKLHVSVWGQGPPVLLTHAWALNGQMWDCQIPALTAAGFRAVVPDRRGHGRSDIVDDGYDLDGLADDLGAVIETLDLSDLTLVGHSAGAQEILRYVTRHGRSRVRGLVLSAPVTPGVLQRDDVPAGIPEAAFEALRATWVTDFGAWVRDNTDAYFGAADMSAQAKASTAQAMLATPLPIVLETHRTLTRADLRADLKALALPVTVIQGTNDASAPIEATGQPTAAMVAGAELVSIDGGGHGLYQGHSTPYNDALITALHRIADPACFARTTA